MASSRPAASDFRDDLVCPVCLDVQRDCKIFQCQNGHLICETCYDGLYECPVCREKLAKPGPRCLFAEKAIAALPIPCPHRGLGCSLEASKKEVVEAHAKTCVYRGIACPVMGCSEDTTAGTLLGHLIKRHEAPEIEADSSGRVELDFPLIDAADAERSSFSVPKIVTSKQKLFVVMFAMQDRNYYTWVYALSDDGKKSPSADRITIGVSTEHLRIFFSVTAVSIDDDWSTVLSFHEMCLQPDVAPGACRDTMVNLFFEYKAADNLRLQWRFHKSAT